VGSPEDKGRVIDLTDAALNQAVVRPDDIELLEEPGWWSRPPHLAPTALGIHQLNALIFKDDPELLERALRVEAHRGTFPTEAVQVVYPNGVVCLDALAKLVSNYENWFGVPARDSDRPRLNFSEPTSPLFRHRSILD